MPKSSSRRRGPGPQPIVPTATQAADTLEGLISRYLADQVENDPGPVPDTENALGWVQFIRRQRSKETPTSDDVIGRLILIRYLEDVLEHEKLAALRDGRRGSLPQEPLSREGLGQTSRQAAGMALARLEARFAKTESAAEGGVRRATRDGGAFLSEQRQRASLAEWASNHRTELKAAAEKLLCAGLILDEDGPASIVLDQLPSDVEWATSSEDWAPVARRLLSAARLIGEELSEASLPAELRQIIVAAALAAS